jgi:hypothetical protein
MTNQPVGFNRDSRAKTHFLLLPGRGNTLHANSADVRWREGHLAIADPLDDSSIDRINYLSLSFLLRVTLR